VTNPSGLSVAIAMASTTIETPAASDPRGTARRTPRRVRSEIVSVRSTPEYKAWLARFSAHLRKDVVDAIDEAILRYARAEGFDLPPKR